MAPRYFSTCVISRRALTPGELASPSCCTRGANRPHIKTHADYRVPFPFTGKIHKLTVRLGPEELTPAEREMIYGTYRNRQ
jgi:hypothetical protein